MTFCLAIYFVLRFYIINNSFQQQLKLNFSLQTHTSIHDYLAVGAKKFNYAISGIIYLKNRQYNVSQNVFKFRSLTRTMKETVYLSAILLIMNCACSFYFDTYNNIITLIGINNITWVVSSWYWQYVSINYVCQVP